MSAQPISDNSVFWSESLADELLRFFTGRLKCPETAAELTHDTYLGLRRAVANNPPDNARAMAFRIAVNLAIDYQRKTAVRNRHASDEDFDRVAEEVAGGEPAPERILSGRQRIEELQKALQELPEACRNVFWLHGVEELTYSEIARRLGISKSQVNKLLAKAMAHCALRLDQ